MLDSNLLSIVPRIKIYALSVYFQILELLQQHRLSHTGQTLDLSLARQGIH
jgi:hypothetical protein